MSLRWGYVIAGAILVFAAGYSAGWIGIVIAVAAYLFGAVQAITYFQPNTRWF